MLEKCVNAKMFKTYMGYVMYLGVFNLQVQDLITQFDNVSHLISHTDKVLHEFISCEFINCEQMFLDSSSSFASFCSVMWS